jgi:Zn finger protein HypA/HybF involved in hydrogenase expression
MNRKTVVCPSCSLTFRSARERTYCPGCHQLVDTGATA